MILFLMANEDTRTELPKYAKLKMVKSRVLDTKNEGLNAE